MSEEYNSPTEPEQTVPIEYEPIVQGDPLWLDKLDSNCRYFLSQVGGNELARQVAEDLQRAIQILRDELQPQIDGADQALQEKVDRDEFQLSQERQDNIISSLQTALDTGFTGTPVTLTFAPGELSQWQGWDGGLVNGAVNAANQLTN